MQYVPPLGWALLKKIGPARARAVSSGRSGYDVSALLREKQQPQQPQGGGGGGSGAGGGGGGAAGGNQR
jgi:hypothetical protein